jgi:hypothetical protein
VSFEFLLRPAIREGEVSHAVIPITIANLDRDAETGEYQFPNSERVSLLRGALAAQSGIPAATILKELASCLPAPGGRRSITPSPQLKVPQPESQGSEPSPPERQRRTVTRQVRLS